MSEPSDTQPISFSPREQEERSSGETLLLQLGVGLVSGVIMAIFIMAANAYAPAWAVVLGGGVFGLLGAVVTTVVRSY